MKLSFHPLAQKFTLFAVITALIVPCYLLIGRFVPPLPHDYGISLPIDHRIPFIPATVWYYMGGLYLPMILSIWIVKDHMLFRRLGFSIFLGAVIDFLVFLVFPVAAPRPVLDGMGRVSTEAAYLVYNLPGDALSGKLMSILYTIDSVICTFPSSHMTYAVCIALALRFQSTRDSAIMWVITILLYFTTLTTKQHFVLDGIGGAFTAVLAHRIAFRGFKAGQLLGLVKGSFKQKNYPKDSR